MKKFKIPVGFRTHNGYGQVVWRQVPKPLGHRRRQNDSISVITSFDFSGIRHALSLKNRVLFLFLNHMSVDVTRGNWRENIIYQPYTFGDFLRNMKHWNLPQQSTFGTHPWLPIIIIVGFRTESAEKRLVFMDTYFFNYPLNHDSLLSITDEMLE
jgi:hypothetical protein